jgi:hypothetical protein
MKPGARLVSYTHDWAIERFGGTKVDDWAAKTAAICERYGLTDAKRWFGRAEDGKIVAFVVRKG